MFAFHVALGKRRSAAPGDEPRWSDGCYFAAETARRAKSERGEGPIRQSFPFGSGRISGQIGKARPPVVGLNGWRYGADELSNARPEMRLASARLGNSPAFRRCG